MLKILIAVDGSEHANRAIEAVGNMVRSSLELEACLICVIPGAIMDPVFSADYSAVTIQKIEDEQKRRQDTVLDQATELAKAQGLRLSEPARAYGVIANEIVRVANERQVDQIAMGTRGMGAISSVFLGSVAQRVIHQASMPVLLAK